VNKACENLTLLNENVIKAVDVRQQLDLRIGASFTVLQTVFLQKHFLSLRNLLVSYGSCQFPTLGFIVNRYRQHQDFIPEKFWKIEIRHQRDGISSNFNWEKVRMFNKDETLSLHNSLLKSPEAKVIFTKERPRSKGRPMPLG
jgi:DNA topoisomerase-3